MESGDSVFVMNPRLPSGKGKTRRLKTIDGHPRSYEIVDEEVFLASSDSGKAFAIHKLKYDDGSVEFRIGYYMIGRNPKMRGKWAWGQYAPMMTEQEMEEIFDRAQKLKRRCS
jgi:hypothetical protein